MKKLFSITAILLAITLNHAQYSYEILNSEPVNKDIGKIACDANDNTIITGSFYTTITFGSFTLTANMSGSNCAPVFVVKRSSAGVYLWAKAFKPLTVPDNSTCCASLNGLITDAVGNVYLTGNFKGKVSFDNITVSSTKNGSLYTDDIFTVKISAAGVVEWVRKEGIGQPCTNNTEVGNSIVTDGPGNVYTTGMIYLKVGSKWVPSIYVVKYNSSGTKVWEKKYYPDQPENCGPPVRGTNIRCDGINLYIVGDIAGSVTFGTVTLNTGSSPLNMFLLKLNSSGQTIWAKSVTGTRNFTYGQGCYLDKNNSDVFISGIFKPGYPGTSISFGACSLYHEIESCCQYPFLAKYSSDGNCVWAIQTWASFGIVNHPNGNIALLNRPFDRFFIKEVSSSDGVTIDSLSPSIPIYTGSGLIRTSNGFIFSQSLNGSYNFGGITISSVGTNGDLIMVRYSSTPSPLILGSSTTQQSVTGVNFYPNPVSHKLNLQNTEGKMLGHISIYDSMGKEIYSQFSDDINSEIDVSHFPSGMYYVRTTDLKPTVFIKN